MFWSENLSELLFYSEDESQHFRLAEGEESFSFPLSGFLSIEKGRYTGRENSNEYLIQHYEAGQVFTEANDVQSNRADEGSILAFNQELKGKRDSSIADSSSHFLKKNGQKQKNPSPSKNFFLYSWKKVLKCLKLSKSLKLK